MADFIIDTRRSGSLPVVSLPDWVEFTGRTGAKRGKRAVSNQTLALCSDAGMGRKRFPREVGSRSFFVRAGVSMPPLQNFMTPNSEENHRTVCANVIKLRQNSQH
ncbi:MAG: hypothetical protein ACOX7N_01600 [Lawsonibacter sp.]|jgi:hypothetical protein